MKLLIIFYKKQLKFNKKNKIYFNLNINLEYNKVRN